MIFARRVGGGWKASYVQCNGVSREEHERALTEIGRLEVRITTEPCTERLIKRLQEKLKELKLKTECKACGRKGHWQGDKECTMSKLQKTAHLTTCSHDHFSLDDDEDSDRGAGALTSGREDMGETTDDGGTFADNAFFSMKSLRNSSFSSSPDKRK